MSTPTWVAPENNQTFANTHIQQFLGLHGVTCIYQGSSVVQTLGALASQQTLAGFSVDQPFTMSGTSISRVEIPVSVATGNGQDVTAAIYADSGGTPTGSAIVSTTVPKEFISGISSALNFPDAQETLLGPWVNPGNNNILGNSLDGQDNYLNVIASITPGDNSSTITAITDTTGIINPISQIAPSVSNAPWQGATTAINSNGFIYVCGGVDQTNAYQVSVFYATLNLSTGAIGSWVTTTDLPVALSSASVKVIGSNIFVFAGATGVSTFSQTIYQAPINTDGSIGAWTTFGLMPFTSDATNFLPIGGPPIVINNHLIICKQDLSVTPPLVATPYACSIVGGVPMGNWIQWPSISFIGANTDEQVWIASYGNNLICIEGSGDTTVDVWTMSVGTTSPANSWTKTSVDPAFGGNSIAGPSGISGNVISTSGIGYTSIFQSQKISIPLNAIGLTNGTKYHLVISGVGGYAGAQDCQLAIVSSISGGGAFTGHLKQGAGSWVALTSGQGIAATLFSGNTGRLYHTMEDISSGSPTEWNWYLYNLGGNLIGLGENTSQIRALRTLFYDSSGLPTVSN